MRRIAWTLIWAACVVGCGGGSSGPPPGGGGQTDAGAQTDSAGAQTDSARAQTDSAGAQTDSAAPRDTGAPGDGTIPVDPGDPCEPEVITPPTAPGCAAATATCVEACADDTCVDTCFAADPTPDVCQQCLEEAFLSCVNAAGCQSAFDTLMCCAEGCADPDAEECYTVTCAAQGSAFDTCTAAHEDACDDSVCFAP